MTRTLFLTLLTLLPVVALASDDSRVFVRVSGPETSLSMPAEHVDVSVLADLGLADTELERLRARAAVVEAQQVGARAEWRAGALTVALEQRPDHRIRVEDLVAVDDGACAAGALID